jgi:hypothetical protein
MAEPKKSKVYKAPKNSTILTSIENTLSGIGAAMGSPQAQIIRSQDKKRRRSK